MLSLVIACLVVPNFALFMAYGQTGLFYFSKEWRNQVMNQRKQINRIFAFVLVLALTVSAWNGQSLARAAGSITITLRIEQDNATLLPPVSVTLTEADKNNDFGVGLSTGEAATYSPLRAYAKYLSEKGVKKEEMNRYIIASPSDWGGLYVSGISVKGDGVGSASTENLDDVYWMYCVNNESGSVSMSEYALKDKDSVVIYGMWSPYPATEDILYTAFDKGQYMATANRAEITLTGYGTSYDDPENPKNFQKPIEGASIIAHPAGNTSESVATLTNKEGKAVIAFPASDKKITYVLTAAKKDASQTYSVISRPYATVTVPASAPASPKKPSKVQSVKASVKKTKGGAKKISLSWKKVKTADSYQVYISKKKTSGYKKMAEVKKTKTVLKRKKGAWYIKVRACRNVSGKKITGTFSNVKTVKIK